MTDVDTYHARALAMAIELQRLLGELKERPRGDYCGIDVHDAWARMHDVVALLEPVEFDELDEPDPPPPPQLHLVAS